MENRQLILTMLIVAFSGCLGSSIPTGTVSGKVTYKGAQVPEGSLISFISDSGFAALGTVDSKGQYQLIMAGKTDIPVAKYKVTVTVPGLQGPEMTAEDERKFMAGDPATVAKFSGKKQKPPLPEKFSDPNQSGLSIDIKKGANPWNIELN